MSKADVNGADSGRVAATSWRSEGGVFSLDETLEMAAANLLEAREQAETYHFSPELIQRIDLLKRAIGRIRKEAIEERGSEYGQIKSSRKVGAGL